MRLFEVQPGGHSPFHNHSWEHEVFVIEGEGTVIGESTQTKFKQGSVVFVLPNEKHQFKNDGKGVLKFLCLVPIEKR
jgi:quercetin dioxygenase-like cupin family protein